MFERFNEGFEAGADGFFYGGDYGAVTVVPSGTGGVTAADGASFAIFEQTDSGPFTRFDGYRSVDSDQGFTTQVSIYLDPGAWSAGEGFDYSVAANNQSGAHLRDFIFHVTQDTSTGQLLVGASNNSNFDPVENLESGNHAVITTAGWYTFEHTFYNAGDDTLAVSMTVKNASDITLFAEVLNNPSDTFSTMFGGNRYGWFTNIDVAGGIAVDEVVMSTSDANPVVVKEGGIIVATYASIQDAKDALDNGDITVTSAEISTTGADDAFYYVAEGMSIQAAIDASSDGDLIEVAAGTFEESFTIDKEVTMTGAGAGQTIVTGTLLDDLSVPDGMPLNDYFEANNPAYSASLGVQISADNVSFSGFTITSFSEAMAINTSDGVSITDNEFIDNVTGMRKGTAQNVTNVTISNNSFSQGVHGITIYAASDGSGAFDGVTMDENMFSSLSEKGMYFEQLANAELNDNVFDDVGNFGRISPPFGGTQGEFGQAIDINLKYENYENVVFNDTIITNSGNSDQDGAASPGDFGAAVGVKIRDDGSYSAQPATFTGSIVFNGGSIDGTSTGFRVGEPGKNNLGPNVDIDGVEISNATVSDVENATDPSNGGVTEVTMAPSQGTLDASSSQASLDITGTVVSDGVLAGSGDDTIFGGGGDDSLDGGAGFDTVVYNGFVDDYSAVLGSLTVTDENAGDGDDGTDALFNIEAIAFADTTVRIVGGDSEYTTIQSAIDAADAGDIIVVRAGTYNESLSISKEITLLGEDVGDDGVPDVILNPAGSNGIDISGDIDDGGSATVSISGFAIDGASGVGVRISSSTMLSALEITDSAFSNNGTHGVGSGSGAPGLGSISISNSTFENNGQGGSNGAGDIVLFGFTGDATIEDVSITSSATEGTAVSARGDNAIQISGYDPSTYDVQGAIGNVTLNNVTVDGWYHKPQLAIQGYTDFNGLTLTGVDLTGGTSWGDLLFIDPIGSSGQDAPGNSGYPGNFPLTGGSSDLDLSGVTVNSGSTSVLGVDSRVRGTDADDSIAGTNGADLLNDFAEGGYDYGGDDTVRGLGGDDILIGGAGADLLEGGDGNDSLDGGSGADVLLGFGGNDYMSGGDDADSLVGFGGHDMLEGGDGDDYLSGQGGYDTLLGGAGDDEIDGGAGIDMVDYSAYSDAITVDLASNPFAALAAGTGFASGAATGTDGLTSIEIVKGTQDDDVISGSVMDETLSGEGGNDTLLGQVGKDVLLGGGGADQLIGGVGDDWIEGGDGADSLEGNAGRDMLIGDADDDTLFGYGSHDTLLGGDGNDDLRGGFGRDLLNGSAGNDLLRGYEGHDRLFGGGGDDTLIGNDGNDSLTGGGGSDRLKGDDGNDTLNGRFGDDFVTGGAGDDLFEFRQSHGNDIYDDFTAGAGTDDVIALMEFGAAFDTFAEVIAAASDDGADTTIDFGGGDSITLLNVVVADLHEDDFIFS